MTEPPTAERAAVIRLRRLERLCQALEIDPLIARLLLDQIEHINELEDELRHLRLIAAHWVDRPGP